MISIPNQTTKIDEDLHNKRTFEFNKKIKIILTIGIILLITGMLLIFHQLIPIIFAKNLDDLENNWDEDTKSFKSYRKGDHFIIAGKIKGIIENKKLLSDDELKNSSDYLINNKFGGKYTIILEDKKFEILSQELSVSQGDYIIIDCEVQIINYSGETEYILKARSYYNPIPITGIGIILLIFGIICIIKVYNKKRIFLKAESKPYKIANYYQNMENRDTEDALYGFMKSKETKKTKEQKQISKIKTGPKK